MLRGAAAMQTDDGPYRASVPVHLRRAVRRATYSSRWRHRRWRHRQLSSSQSPQPALGTLLLPPAVPGSLPVYNKLTVTWFRSVSTPAGFRRHLARKTLKNAGYCNSDYTHPFNDPFSGTTCVSRYQNGKTNLDFTEVRDSEWQWHQLGHMQVCT